MLAAPLLALGAGAPAAMAASLPVSAGAAYAAPDAPTLPPKNCDIVTEYCCVLDDTDAANGLCWNLDSRVAIIHIAVGSCQPNDANEEWHFVAVGNSHQDSLIENVAAGEHWAVQCCSAIGEIEFANGATDGTEYWFWTTTGTQ